MSSSTVIIKQPSNVENKAYVARKNDHCFFKLIAICLWGLVAIVTSANTELSSNLSGISVTITTQDCIVMLLTTWFLARGLSESNFIYVLPWLFMSIWSMYNCHYLGIVKMLNVLQRARMKSLLPWIAVGIDGLGLVLRALLSVRVLHLAMNQWCNNKLRNELKKEI